MELQRNLELSVDLKEEVEVPGKEAKDQWSEAEEFQGSIALDRVYKSRRSSMFNTSERS